MNNKLFFFDTLITPKIMTVFYWIMLLGVVVFGLNIMFGGFQGFTLGRFIEGLFFIAGGAVFVRIWCELMIVIFKIHENLQNLKK